MDVIMLNIKENSISLLGTLRGRSIHTNEFLQLPLLMDLVKKHSLNTLKRTGSILFD
ncbi:hypothetical protein [Alkalihalobacillus sp. TS-13]|uniref:hypothetical protein n=1 Tax=Alkalihalobacillus sp. TS-13 TaxID=2842455 RepID=UPI001C87A894|nr:hypothetical protein [Alkalihalobacillus sp. TS-13]